MRHGNYIEPQDELLKEILIDDLKYYNINIKPN